MDRDPLPFLGKFRGVVTDDADPQGLGRIKVRVPALANDEEAWALPCVAATDHVSIPAVGARVWIEFERGDPNFPIWSGVFWLSPEDVPPIRAMEAQVRTRCGERSRRMKRADRSPP